MTDAAIKDALRAAAAEAEEWHMTVLNRRRILTPEEVPHMIAAAVAAFLRALPDWHMIPPGRRVSAAYLHALAAAVEKAASDE